MVPRGPTASGARGSHHARGGAARQPARRHPDPVDVVAGDGQPGRQVGAQLGRQFAVSGAVLRHGIEPAVHQHVDRVDGDAEHRAQIRHRPRLQFGVGGGVRDRITEPAEGHSQQLGVPARAPLAAGQRDRLGVQAFSAGHQHPGLRRQRGSAGHGHRQHGRRGDRYPGRRRCARRDVADQAGQLRGGHGHDHRIRAPRRALVVAQHPPGPSAAMCRTAVCTQRSPLRRTNSSSSTR